MKILFYSPQQGNLVTHEVVEALESILAKDKFSQLRLMSPTSEVEKELQNLASDKVSTRIIIPWNNYDSLTKTKWGDNPSVTVSALDHKDLDKVTATLPKSKRSNRRLTNSYLTAVLGNPKNISKVDYIIINNDDSKNAADQLLLTIAKLNNIKVINLGASYNLNLLGTLSMYL